MKRGSVATDKCQEGRSAVVHCRQMTESHRFCCAVPDLCPLTTRSTTAAHKIRHSGIRTEIGRDLPRK